MTTVFISHAFDEVGRRLAQNLRNELAAAGIDGYLAIRAPRYSVLLHDRTRGAIDGSDWLVAVITAGARKSPSVYEEIGYAIGMGIKVVIMHEKGVEKAGALVRGRETEEFTVPDFKEHALRVAGFIRDSQAPPAPGPFRMGRAGGQAGADRRALPAEAGGLGQGMRRPGGGTAGPQGADGQPGGGPEAGGDDYDVFLSYSHDAKDGVARPLVEGLKRRGVRVWWDHDEMGIGDTLCDRIKRGLDMARHGVVIASAGYLASGWGLTEQGAMFGKGMPTYCILRGVDVQAVQKMLPTISGTLMRRWDDSPESIMDEIADAVGAGCRAESAGGALDRGGGGGNSGGGDRQKEGLDIDGRGSINGVASPVRGSDTGRGDGLPPAPAGPSRPRRAAGQPVAGRRSLSAEGGLLARSKHRDRSCSGPAGGAGAGGGVPAPRTAIPGAARAAAAGVEPAPNGISTLGTATPRRLLGGPIDTKTHLRYARESMERSDNLFKAGDMRHAIFAANEGLELCAKAYLLHYKIISDPIESGHFPYPVLIKNLRKLLISIEKHGPDHGDMIRHVHKQLGEFEKFFAMLKDRKKASALWKWSLGLSLGPEDKRHFEEIEGTVLGWGRLVPGAQGADPQKLLDQVGAARTTKKELDACFTGILGLFHKNKKERNAWLRAAPFANKGVPLSDLLYFGQVIAYTELFLYTSDILRGYVHQQPSRYPTMIDGVDSGTLYRRHRGAVKRLLARIYRATESLMRHLDASSTPVLRSSAALHCLGGLRA